jgi:serine/threonine-protein kinase
MAPEQVLRGEQDHRVDIYQLGVVLYELLTRQNPFKGPTAEATLAKICTETPPPPGKANPDVPKQIDAIVARCLEKSPTKRFQTASELARALADYLRSGVHQGIAPDRELVDRLRKFELFALFSDDEIHELVKVGEFVTCSAGEYIIPENAADSDFFVLLEGNVTVEKKQRVLSDFLPGACFGEIGAFARQKRTAGVLAREDCKLLRINAVLFKQLDPLLQLKMLHIVVRNLASLVISLDGEIMKLTDAGASALPTTVCPLCGFDNGAIIEVCPRCGVIPSMYAEQHKHSRGSDSVTQNPTEPSDTADLTLK